MIKKIIKAVNVVFGNFVRVQSRLSFDEENIYKKLVQNQKELVIQKINLLFNMIYILLFQRIMQKNI